MNETTFELNTSSTASQQDVWHEKTKESEKMFLKARFIITTVLFVLGLFGNTSIILVLRGLKSPTSILTIYMAIFDTLALMAKVFNYGLTYFTTERFRYFYCLTWFIPTNVFVTSTNWTLVVLCTERFILIFFPLKHRFIFLTKRVHVTMATLFSTIVVYSVLLNVLNKFYNESSRLCIILNNSSHYIKIICVSFAVPFLLTAVLTTSIIVKLNISKPASKHVRKSHLRHKMENTLIRLMLCTAILFVFLTMPGNLYYSLIRPAINYKHVNPVLDVLLFLLYDLSNILNFFIYLIFIKAFRKSFQQIITRNSSLVLPK